MEWEPPEWLGRVAHNSFKAYVPNDAHPIPGSAMLAWSRIPWELKNSGSLFDCHQNALRGSEPDLAVMKIFYANLVAERLKK